MKMQLSRNIVFFVLMGVVITGCSLVPVDQPLSTSRPFKSNIITRENALTGTSSWKIPPGKGASTQIQAYAGATSVSPGKSLTFYVSTQKEGTPYSIVIFRLGWYGGYGARAMASPIKQIGFAQGYYDVLHKRLVNCNSCRISKQTGLIEANWLPSYTLTVPFNWITGVYLAKFTEGAGGMQTYVPFDVRGNDYSPYVAVTADMTDQAYNYWGGYSLYIAENDLGPESLGRAVKVSFDRPYTKDYGAGYLLSYEVDSIRWLERQGYDLAYISSIDLHEDPGQLLHHRAYLSLGHDEYWTKEMRDGVERARDQGVGLAFLEADDAYWQIRMEPDSDGVVDRTIVCYKVLTAHKDLTRDPLYGHDNSRVTSLWKAPVLGRPENALIGIMFSSYTSQQLGFPWRVSPTAKSPLLQGTGLQPGQQYGCDLVGYEWDRVFSNGMTPPGLNVLATSQVKDNFNKLDVSNTTYYIARSGALVFATGSVYWTAALDYYHLYIDVDSFCNNQSIVVYGMQKLMEHVMDALVLNHSSGS